MINEKIFLKYRHHCLVNVLPSVHPLSGHCLSVTPLSTAWSWVEKALKMEWVQSCLFLWLCSARWRIRTAVHFYSCSQWWSLCHFHHLHKLGQGVEGDASSQMLSLKLEILLFFKCALVSVTWAVFIYCNTCLVRSSDDIHAGALLPWGGRSNSLWGFVPLRALGSTEILSLNNPWAVQPEH